MVRVRHLWHSLQAQLMLISIATCISVLAGAGGIATWRLHQDLLAESQKQHMQALDEFEQDVTTYQEMYPATNAIDKTIERHSQPNLWFRVVDEAGQTLATSTMLPADLDLEGVMPDEPELIRSEDHNLILCSSKLKLADQSQVQVQAISDVTQSYAAYRAFITTLALSGTGTVLVVAFVGMILIRRALQPLHKISHMSASISAEQLKDARVMLEDAPNEVQDLAEAFNEMLNRLSLSWSQEQQLLSNISHELRTPLSVVQGYLESTLRRGQNLNEMQVEGLNIALEETQRVVRLLRDLLDLARAETGSFHLQVEPIPLNEFVQEIESIAHQLGPNPIALLSTSQPVTVKADRDRLKQVMLNLLTNAVRYSEPTAPITIRLRTSGDTALLQVQDQGIGIPIEHQLMIFERFYCVSDSRSRREGGIGLGLAITKALVENMRGKIMVESQPNVGSTFTVILPMVLTPHQSVERVSVGAPIA